ncbi:low molecular weight protein-tyrosine-phosphatase [Caryophanon tenue]|uniref:protein-tyrosine-phosphatase n=1 Tax=Caryophanon tenue TaxID=33978 RepID=A0A1C0YBM6_9BACL|nr:low molecular weight protein-tyrosine-phosphatase [Caryophanon tenue]OCS84544.1 protein tyrosine phosphatase [Caryophanon tenue]
MIRILFICLGNICRSPMAEAVMRDEIEKRGWHSFVKVDSAGTANYHVGEPPHKGTQAKLREYGISTTGMKARQLWASDFDNFDYLVAMDTSNVTNIQQALRKEDPKIFRFLDLTVHKKDVPDPYYTGDFQETYDLVVDGCRALLEKVQQDHPQYF